MQKSFLLGVLLTSMGAITIGSATPTQGPHLGILSPIRPLNPDAPAWEGCKLPSTDGHSPVSDSDYGMTDNDRANSNSPFSSTPYPTPEVMRSLFPQPRSAALLDGEACARLFEAQQRAARRRQPIDAYVKHHEELLAQLQATLNGNRAILATFMEMINSQEPMARQELEAGYDRVTASMMSRQHTPDEARARQNILQRQQAAFAKILRKSQKALDPLQAKQEARIRTQRQAEADRLRAHHPGYKPAPIQRCPITGKLFNIDTLRTYSAPQVEWLSPAEWQKHQALKGK